MEGPLWRGGSRDRHRGAVQTVSVGVERCGSFLSTKSTGLSVRYLRRSHGSYARGRKPRFVMVCCEKRLLRFRSLHVASMHGLCWLEPGPAFNGVFDAASQPSCTQTRTQVRKHYSRPVRSLRKNYLAARFPCPASDPSHCLSTSSTPSIVVASCAEPHKLPRRLNSDIT